MVLDSASGADKDAILRAINTKDAGEIGVGTDVVMMFELELGSSAESLKYQQQEPVQEQGEFADELFEVRIRYKDPGKSESRLLLTPVTFASVSDDVSSDFGFAASVAAFGHLLRDSDYIGDLTAKDVISMAQSNLGVDEKGYRLEFLLLLKQHDAIDR